MKSFVTVCLILPALATALSSGGGVDRSVVGGSNADIANHPWQASLRVNGSHACGAVLISGTSALTAAHCAGGAASSYSLVAGTSERTIQTCGTCAVRNPLQSIIRHPGFINNPSAGYPDDLAIVLFYHVAENPNIQYIEMAQPSDGEFQGVSCVVSGWGQQKQGGELPTILQEATMTALANTRCAGVWGTNRIRPEQICAHEAGVSLCMGDQGGPIVCNGKLAGVFSWGEANCSPDFPAVFNRVSSYYDWIIENVVRVVPEDEYDVAEADFDFEISLAASLFS